MPFFRFLFKGPDELRFQEGTYFEEKKAAEMAVMNYQDLHPENQCGYIEIDDPNGGL